MVIKKRGSFIWIFLILFLGLNFSLVSAALGISPAKMTIDFEPGGKFFSNFQSIGVASEQKLIVYAKGDFADYVTFDRTKLVGRQGFTAYLNLPNVAEKPGENKLYIMVGEEKKVEQGFGARLEVGALILIKVPYPGKYAEIKRIYVNEVNEGEPIDLGVEVENLGTENILVNSELVIYSDGEFFKEYDLGSRFINTKESYTFSKTVHEGYDEGSYVAKGIIRYDSIIKNISREFQVGTLFIEVLNWTKEVIVGKIGEFNIEIKSKWNNEINNVYAEVNVTDDEEQVDYFKTPSIPLGKQSKGILKGHVNAEQLKTGKYQARIKLFYDGESSEEVVDFKVKYEKQINYIYVVGGVVIVMLLIAFLVLFFKGRKK